MATEATTKRTSSGRPSEGFLSAGQMARAVRNNQMKRPAKRKICQKRPRSTYS
jgi:hypothetical protein